MDLTPVTYITNIATGMKRLARHLYLFIKLLTAVCVYAAHTCILHFTTQRNCICSSIYNHNEKVSCNKVMFFYVCFLVDFCCCF